MPRTSDALQTLRHAFGRLQLHDQIHRANVNAQFERTCADERGQFARFQIFFQCAPRLFGHAAVMRANGTFGADGKNTASAHDAAGRERSGTARFNLFGLFRFPLRVQAVGGAFRETTAVGKNQRRMVTPNIIQHIGNDVGPNRIRAAELSKIVHDCDDFEFKFFLIARINHRNRPRCENGLRRQLLAAQKTRDLCQRFYRRRESDALNARRRNML